MSDCFCSECCAGEHDGEPTEITREQLEELRFDARWERPPRNELAASVVLSRAGELTPPGPYLRNQGGGYDLQREQSPGGVDLLRSKLDGRLAVSVCDLVHGGDGGPWTVLQSWELDPRALGEAAIVDSLRLVELRRLRRTVRELGRGNGPSAVEAYVRGRHPGLFREV